MKEAASAEAESELKTSGRAADDHEYFSGERPFSEGDILLVMGYQDGVNRLLAPK